MKKSELFFSFIQVPVDFIMIFLAALSAFFIRENSLIIDFFNLKPLEFHNVQFESFMKIILFAIPFFILVYALEGLYNIRATRNFLKESNKVFSATTVSLVIVIIAIFLKREWFSSRFIILAAWWLVVLYVIAGRFILQSLQRYILVSKGVGVHRVLLIGSNGKIERFKKIIEDNKSFGYKVVGKIENGSVREIKNIKENRGVDEIILCDPTVTDLEQEKIIDYCSINNIVFRYIPTTFQTSNIEIGMMLDEPIIEVRHTPLDGWGKIAKRVFDTISSALAIVIFAPIMAVVALAVWLESGGPIVYKNERVGGNGKKFFVYKFRYLKKEFCTDPNTPEGRKALEYEKKLIAERSIRKGPLYKIKDDPRKTRVGNFIEKYSLDELPQFLNVLKGEMSLVGPRPHQEREVNKYKEYHRRLLTIKPGVTGIAQVSGRSDLDFEDEYRMDVYYIENWSLWLDILICLKTVGVIFRRRKNHV